MATTIGGAPAVWNDAVGGAIKDAALADGWLKLASGILVSASLAASDVGLGSVDNTSDATKNAAAVTLTNKTLTTPTIASFANATHAHANAAGGGTLAEAALALTDVATGNVSTSAHGFVPKAPNDAKQVLVGDGTWAAVAAPAVPFVSGGYYDPEYLIPGGGWATAAVTAGRLYAMPFYVPFATTLDRIGVNVLTGVTSALGRVGVYAVGTDGKPGALVLQGPTQLDCATSTTNKEDTVSQALSARTWYFLAFVCDSAINIYNSTPTASPIGYGTTNSSITKLGSYFLTLGSLTLPNPFGTPTGTLGSFFRVFVRAA